MDITKRNITETPPNWVVVKIIQGDETFYKVFGGWRGGYLDGDRWKMNSGISRVEEDDEYYYFEGFSGSCYKCDKAGYGVIDNVSHFGAYASGVLSNVIKKGEEQNVKVEIMDDTTDWVDIIKEKV